jgi:hypothetical protein
LHKLIDIQISVSSRVVDPDSVESGSRSGSILFSKSGSGLDPVLDSLVWIQIRINKKGWIRIHNPGASTIKSEQIKE